MRRLAIGAVVLLLYSVPAAAQTSPTPAPGRSTPGRADIGPRAMLLARVDSYRPTDGIFKSVYGNGSSFGGEARIRAARRLYVAVDAGSMKKSGALTLTGEATTIALYPVDAMMLFYLATGRIAPYAAAGAATCKWSESNIIGSVGGWGAGIGAAAGVTAAVHGRFVIDLRVKYRSVRVKPAQDQANLGGLSLGLGAGITF